MTEIVVVGAGNAGLCAAISAAQRSVDVLLIDAAPEQEFGGNSALTMNMRFAHDHLEQILSLLPRGAALTGYLPYPAAAYEAELHDASNGSADSLLIKKVAHESLSTVQWLRQLGHEWEVKPDNLRLPSAMPVRLVDGGRGLQRRNLEVARGLGVRIAHSTRATSLLRNPTTGAVTGVTTDDASRPAISAAAVILASGGFQGSPRLRKRFLGDQWESARLRGVPFNDGAMLEAALAVGAAHSVDMKGLHSTPQAIDIPAFRLPSHRDASQLSSRYAFHLGITVDIDGERFFDEGSDFPNLIYASVGANIVARPGGIAFQLFNRRLIPFLPTGYSIPAPCAPSFARAATEFDTGVRSGHTLNYAIKDGLGTEGLKIPKSNWASRIGNLPAAYAVRAGLTFTYGGLQISDTGQVLNNARRAIPGLFACGEIVGGIFTSGYPGGSGMAAGAVMGRICGESATRFVRGSL